MTDIGVNDWYWGYVTFAWAVFMQKTCVVMFQASAALACTGSVYNELIRHWNVHYSS